MLPLNLYAHLSLCTVILVRGSLELGLFSLVEYRPNDDILYILPERAISTLIMMKRLPRLVTFWASFCCCLDRDLCEKETNFL